MPSGEDPPNEQTVALTPDLLDFIDRRRSGLRGQRPGGLGGLLGSPFGFGQFDFEDDVGDDECVGRVAVDSLER